MDMAIKAMLHAFSVRDSRCQRGISTAVVVPTNLVAFYADSLEGCGVLRRAWSILAVFGIFCLIMSGFLSSEEGRAAAAVLSFGLVVHVTWFAQRRHV